MSESYVTTSPGGSGVQTAEPSGKVDAAKQEAADLKDTAATQAKDVLGTAKDEASTVLGEAKFQAKDLYAQTQQELKDQASTQQRRVAAGLRSVSDDLGAMAANSNGGGVAADVVHQISTRLSSASSWLGDRDPSAVLDEVKRFARRRPGTFILGAAITGIIVGRLTRALASNASDDKDATSSASAASRPALPPVPAPQLIESDPWTATPVGSAADAGAGTPLYAQTASGTTDILAEDGDGRSDTI